MHPLVCYDEITGDLIKIQLRDGTQYSNTGVVDFLQPILDEYLEDFPEIKLLLRGDSGFSTPSLYKQCEENGTGYVIRLKENAVLRDKASYLVDELDEKYKQKAIDMYGEKVIEEAVKKQKGREQEIADGFNNIFFAISDNMSKGLKATSKENIELAKKLHKHICEYSFDCSADVFSSIGYGYVKNPEFKNNMDKFGEGMAQYLFDAIQQYVKEI